ncbi:hypothetical protein BDV29DRAFT_164819 [Aspergillus leporis]|uniref:CFEM domain-containing protein n=1 Tax=Aspergillus leporis TaxID=41062 RepID=A0A5N5XF47_9EURO|nr:hypothetical protein BDV29DRAFT_164819 [Aspergillus leporis]
MQFSHALIVLFAGLATAQLNVPPCSLQCILGALSSDGCTTLTDFSCHCQKPELVEKVTPCVQKSCGLPEQSAVSRLVVSQCSAAGHPITIPNPTASTTTHPPGSDSTTAGSTGSGSAHPTPTDSTKSATGSVTIPTVSSSTKTNLNGSSTAGSSSSHAHGSSSTSSASSSTPGTSSSDAASSSGSKSSSAPSGKSSSSSVSPPLKTNGASHVTGSFAGVAIAAAAAYYHL